MSPSHAVKNGRRYRYYVIHATTLTSNSPPCERVPASEVERRVVGQLLALLRDRHALSALVTPDALDAALLQALVAKRLASLAGRCTDIPKLTARVSLDSDTLEVLLDHDGLVPLLCLEGVLVATLPAFTASVVKVRAGKDVPLILGTPGVEPRDDKLVSLLCEAHVAHAAPVASGDKAEANCLC